MCPVYGCHRVHKKLSQHLKRAHPTLSNEQRKHYLKTAKVVPSAKKKSRIQPLPRGQLSLAAFARGKPKLIESEEYKELASLKQGTRPFPSFPLGKGLDIDKLFEWLQGVEGKTRKPDEARQIVMDVSKAIRSVMLNPNPNPNPVPF